MERLDLSINDVIEFFDYSDDFWDYAFSKTMKVDSTNKESEGFYGVFYQLDEEERLQGFKIVVPRIIDLRTALVNVHEYKHAYDLYQKFNQKIEEDSSYENSAKAAENEFRAKILSKNAKNVNNS